ncbi:MAG: class I SAM-dependent methyltransferase [Candidatus Pacebacteria bacterium]|nr:class I SAM-dependent methyltransferase [Candidatus Paceibacterota bacterium]
MSNQGNVWEKEYNNPKLVTKKEDPQADTLRFLKFLKKTAKIELENLNILDLGCGTGRNSNYLAKLGNNVTGIEISKTALSLAQARAKEQGLLVNYILGDIGEPYDLKNSSMDIILDITSSNSLNEKGREVYLKETSRVLKEGLPAQAGGYFFVRALCKDGDKNAKNLLKTNPGKEYDTYIIKEIGLTERVFSKEDFIKIYSKYFKIIKLEKKSGYTRFNNRVYKRDYWLAYLTK